tara:strand:- start:6546 stop:7391 length:846 start_codon:yes stop_codon:yes gene_type:complete
MGQEIYNDFIINFVSSLVTLIILLLSSFVIITVFKKKNYSSRKYKKLKNRVLYISFLIYVFCLAKIWVDGFTQLITVLGLVSAALVVTNKESIMSLVGCLVINWRDLFTEGDLIQIDTNKGYVKSIGPLYITMEETIDQTGYLKTGRILKIPNNQIILHSTINFNYEDNPVLQEHEFNFNSIIDIKYTKKIIIDILKEILDKAEIERGKNKKNKGNNHIKKFHISTNLKQNKDTEHCISMKIYFYSYIDEYENIKTDFISSVLKSLNHKNEVNIKSINTNS